ncbi:hypothetical protein ABBQ38_003222 [Trebouxia sp. C0009 RCD-2024]
MSGSSWLAQCNSFLGYYFGVGSSHGPQYQEAISRFSKDELSSLRAGFEKIRGPEHTLDKPTFLAFLSLDSLDAFLADRLFSVVSQGQDRVSFDQLVIAKANCLKGSASEAASFCFNLLDVGRRGLVQRDSLVTASHSCATLALHHQPVPPPQNTHWAQATAAGALEGCEAQGLSFNAFLKWSKQLPALLTGLKSLLAAGSIDTGSTPASAANIAKVPQLMYGDISETSCLLSPQFAWLLSSRLPAKQSDTWELLFYSNKHGQSFNTFMGKVAGKGPTMLLVKDKAGHVFGGYASEPWLKNGKYYGNFSSFLFQLLPSVAVYTPSGVNQNFQYCGHNFASLPNGIGFGGQVGYWSLFVDGSFEKGMSHKGATYTNTTALSADTRFEVDVVECWLTQQPEEDALGPPAAGSVLDRFKEDRNLMALAGKGTSHSAGYREVPPEED